jgi:membrane protein
VNAKLQRWRDVIVRTFKNWFAHDSTSESAALAFYTVSSLAPLLVIVVAVAGSIFGADAVRGRLVRQFEGLMGRDQAGLIQTVLTKANSDPAGGAAAIFGAILLIVSATAVFAQLQASLNRIWEVEPKPGHFVKDFLRKRLLSFAVVVAIGFILLVSLVLSAGLEAVQSRVSSYFATQAAWLGWLNAIVSFLLIAVLFALVFRVLPDRKIPWRDVWLGALVTALLFVVGKWAIGLYLGRAAISSTYGAAGSVIVLLLWVYYASFIVLLGAEFTRAYSLRIEKHAVPPEKGAKTAPAGADVPT